MTEASRDRGSLRDLNERFLALQRMRPEFGGRVSPLSARQRAAVADCPYALFDLRFHDGAHWRTRLGCLCDDAGSRGADSLWRIADQPPAVADLEEFMRLALFFAWHLAAAGGRAARLVLGMHEETAEAFGRITVARLPELVSSESVNLSARWSHCEPYWTALFAAASADDDKGLRRVQLYGIQLAAAAQLPLQAEPRLRRADSGPVREARPRPRGPHPLRHEPREV